MPGFINSDGSELVGGVNPSGAGQALQLDSFGQLKVAASVNSGPTNITQVNGSAVSGTNGLPVSGYNGTGLQVLQMDGSGNLKVVGSFTPPAEQNVNLNQLNGTAPGIGNPLAVGGSKAGTLTPLLLDASGNLQVNVAATVANQSVNLAQVGGAAPGVGNPVITQDSIRSYITTGQAFNATTGKVAVTAANIAFSIFSATTNTKNLYIFSLEIFYTNANGIMHDIRLVTTDPNYSNAANVSNTKPGGGTQSAQTNVTYSTTTATATGTPFSAPATGQGSPAQVFGNGKGLLLPAGAANGLVVFRGNTNAGYACVNVNWIEF